MKDEFLLQSLLFSASSRLAIMNTSQNPDEPNALLVRIFRHLNRQLQDYSTLSDTTIGIVTCLAMVEVFINFQYVEEISDTGLI